MSEKIDKIFEDFKEAWKGKDPKKYEAGIIAGGQVAVNTASETLVNEMPKYIKKGNEQEKIAWVTENYQIQVQEKMEAAVEYLEKYYDEHNPE